MTNPFLPIAKKRLGQSGPEHEQDNPFMGIADAHLKRDPVLVPDNPKTEARLYRLSQDTGVPLEVTRNRESEVRRQQMEESIDLVFIDREAPDLGQHLRHPERGPVIAHDVKPLSAIEQTVRVFRAVPETVMGAFAGVPEAASGALTAGVGALSEWTPEGPISGTLRELAEASAERTERFTETRKYWEGTSREGLGPTAKAALSGLESSAALMPALLSSVLTKNPTPVLAWAGMVSGGKAAEDARQRGHSYTSQLSHGGVHAGIEVLTELAPALKLLSDLKVGSGFFTTLMNQVVTEIPQEQAATLLQDAQDWIRLNPEKTFGEYLEERPSAAWQTLVATITGAGVTTSTAYAPTAVANFMEERHRKRQRRQGQATLDVFNRRMKHAGEQETLDTLVASAKESATLRDDPALFNEVTEDSLGQESVYLNADQAMTFFQEGPVTFEEFAQAVPEMAVQMEEAVATGGDFVLPANKVVAALATNDGLAELQPFLRLTPDSIVEQEYDDMLAIDVAEGLDAQEAPSQAVERGQAIETRLSDEIQATGVTARTARQYAQAYRSFYDTTRQRIGDNQQALAALDAAMDRLTFRRDMGPDEIEASLNRLRQGRVPTDEDIYGESLMPYLRGVGITDPGGELANRDVDVALAPGQKKLIQETGKELDLVAELAYEQGYIDKADPDVLLEAIDRELGGQSVYRTGQERQNLLDLRRDLDDLDRTLSQAGIDLSTETDNAKIMTLLQGDPDAMRLFQSLFHGSPYKFDRFDMAAIGTGEGAQAFGWGLYFAQQRGVAENYAWHGDFDGVGFLYNQENPNLPESTLPASEVGHELVLELMDEDVYDQYVWFGEDGLKRYSDKLREDGQEQKADELDRMLKDGEITFPEAHMYEVEVDDSHVDKMLDWDAPLSEQQDSVREELSNEIEAMLEEGLETGADLYNRLSENEGGQKAASEHLNSLGIPGIKFFDGESRTKGEGTRNIVVFDPSIIKVLTRNGQPVAEEQQSIREGTPLSDIFMPAQEMELEDGTAAMVELTAEQALAPLDQKVQALEKLRECLQA